MYICAAQCMLRPLCLPYIVVIAFVILLLHFVSFSTSQSHTKYNNFNAIQNGTTLALA